MGTAYSATARLHEAVFPDLPQGDPANLPFAREFLDDRALVTLLLRGHGAGDATVVVGGDAAAPSLTISDQEIQAVRDPNLVWRAGGSLGAATVLPGALAASTVHYLYLRSDAAGALTFVVSTTAPTGRYLGVTNELRRLVATFVTGLLGFPLPAVVGQRRGRYIASSGRAELIALQPGAVFGGAGGVGRATTWTAVDLSHLVPPSATTAWVMARVSRASTDPNAVELRVRRSSADGGSLVAAVASYAAHVTAGTTFNDDSAGQGLVQVPLLAQAFEYELSAVVTDDPLYGARFTVVGWE